MVSGPNCASATTVTFMSPCQHSGPYFLIHGIGLFWCKEEEPDLCSSRHLPFGAVVQRSIFWVYMP